MLRAIVTAAGLLALAAAARADDAIPADVVRDVKQATVFIHIPTPDGNRSGSGFVVSADGATVLVVTNHHVAAKGPTKGIAAEPPAIKVVFDSGTKSERAYPAEVVAADTERDLAVLKLTGVKDAPKPIACAEPVAPFETMTVYSFGFPFGQELATGKGFPAITVGRASVSSLRNGDDGELATIQIDGNLNPGNSGGPVVDGKGRLVGVAVAKLKDGQGIGFLVPAEQVVQTMAGRVGRVRVFARKGADGKPAVRIEADLIDPTGFFRGATAYYVVVPPQGKVPDAAALDKFPGSGRLRLRIEKGVAAGDFAVDKLEGQIVAQVVAERIPGGKVVASRVRGFPLFAAPTPEDLAGPPPDGWTDYVPRDRSFAVWLPAKPARQAERQRDVRAGGEAMRVSSVAGKTADGLSYSAEYVILPPSLANQPPVRLHAAIRSLLLDEGRGRFTESVEAQSGSLQGVQYRIEYDDEVARARVFIGRGVVRLVRVAGTADQVAAREAETILLSFRLPGDKGPEVSAPREIPRPSGKDVPARHPAGPMIIAGERSPPFKDVAPKGGVLIGLEVGVGKFGPWDTISAVRPIYRVDGKEEFGAQHGTRPASPITIKAKDGYAVGEITCISGLNFDGCSLTFMKVTVGGLDPKDSYESDWVGQVSNKRPVRLTGGGRPAIGIAGRGTDREVHGLGLVFKGLEGSDSTARPPTIVGFGAMPPFKELAPGGGLLIGLEIGLGKFGPEDVIKAVRPIYRVGGKEEFGWPWGPRPTAPVTVKAKEGYAVGAMTCKGGLNFDGCSLTFMKVKDGRLDPADAYESEWVGGNGKGQPTRLGGDGTPVVGIVGRGTDEVRGLGLLFKGQERFDADGPPRPEDRGKVPYIFGSIRDPMFKTVGPAGGVLIGLEAKFSKFGGSDIVRAVRPIYRVGGKEETGLLAGGDLTGAVKLKAKDGYAVGGMSAKADWWCHGFSLTYMKVKSDGTLDPKDSYESEWVGWDGRLDVVRHTGNGAPAVGLVGKIVGRETTALGLLFRGQEGFDPDAQQREDRQLLSVPLGKDPYILGSSRDPMFKAEGPAGGLLIGMEAKFNRFGSHDIVRAVRPIYRLGGKEEFGKPVGGDLTGAVTLKAKDGYAVGAITGKATGVCHGFALTYMRVKADGMLDPKDSYESAWAGWNGWMPMTRTSGDGTPVVGLVGKMAGTETTALGLLFKGQEAFDPSAAGR
jgi:S1-C subfamily serine protease